MAVSPGAANEAFPPWERLCNPRLCPTLSLAAPVAWVKVAVVTALPIARGLRGWKGVAGEPAPAARRPHGPQKRRAALTQPEAPRGRAGREAGSAHGRRATGPCLPPGLRRPACGASPTGVGGPKHSPEPRRPVGNLPPLSSLAAQHVLSRSPPDTGGGEPSQRKERHTLSWTKGTQSQGPERRGRGPAGSRRPLLTAPSAGLGRVLPEEKPGSPGPCPGRGRP